jgi:predicted nucleic acid-binding protein
VTHGADTTFLVAVEIVEHEHHADALRVLDQLLDSILKQAGLK